jgi:hypothetical protein
MKIYFGFATAFFLTTLCSMAQAQTVSIDACDFFQSAQEAQAVFERNPADYAFLDANRNGLACETLPTRVRSDGVRVSSGSTSQGWQYEIWRSSIDFAYDAGGNFDVFYVKAWRQNNPATVLTTGNFDSQQHAYRYFRDYLQ